MRSPRRSESANRVCILDRQRRFRINAAALGRAVAAVLADLRVSGQELNVVLVSDRTMRGLNRQWRSVTGPTDVISFPMKEGEGGDRSGMLLGDVVLSLDTLDRQCRQQFDDGRPATGTRARELALMAIHGILHLVGYDHEHGGPQAARMIGKETALFNRWGKLFPGFSKTRCPGLPGEGCA